MSDHRLVLTQSEMECAARLKDIKEGKLESEVYGTRGLGGPQVKMDRDRRVLADAVLRYLDSGAQTLMVPWNRQGK